MAATTYAASGAVRSVWRYPVKSMFCEELITASLDAYGVLGDRVHALVDRSDGKVATAKNPRKWPNLFAFHAMLGQSSGTAGAHALRITLPDGTAMCGDHSDIDAVLSKALNREVTLTTSEHGRSSAPSVKAEEYWPDVEGLDYRDTVTDFVLPTGTFFDCATVHVLTTATLDRLHRVYPKGRFEVSRFRPNIVVDSIGDEQGSAETSWIGRTLAIGDEVRLQVTA